MWSYSSNNLVVSEAATELVKAPGEQFNMLNVNLTSVRDTATSRRLCSGFHVGGICLEWSRTLNVATEYHILPEISFGVFSTSKAHMAVRSTRTVLYGDVITHAASSGYLNRVLDLLSSIGFGKLGALVVGDLYPCARN